MRELFEPAAYAVGVDELVLGRLHRPLHPFVFDGHLAGLAAILAARSDS